MKQENGKVQIYSYYSRLPGACQAEWIDDKIESLLDSGYEISLITSISALPWKNDKISHWRAPSLSIVDFFDEIKRSYHNKAGFSPFYLLYLPFILSIGLLSDLCQYLITRGIGEGRWSWSISASLVGIFQNIFSRNIQKIFTTGGPASAHLAGLINGKLTGKKVIVEFQDPLSGENIGRNASAKGYLYLIERFIINQADKIVYVTKFAAAFAKQQFKSPKIHAIYPGAKRFDIQESQKEKKEEKSFFTFVHLGSLYSTRNFDSIISAINRIQEKDKSIIEKVEIINVGHVAQDIKERIEMQPYIRIKELMPRKEALNFAAQADALLLIQNTDNRSNVTIPFKTYDYLNLGNTILGLLNSEELSQIIREHGHIAVDVNDIEEISKMICLLIDGQNDNSKKTSIDIKTQSLSILELK